MKTIAVIPGAGSGKRYGNVSKAFLPLGGRPVISWVFDLLEGIEEINEVIPVFKDIDMEKGLKLIEERGYKKIKRIAPGGRERQDSVFHALNLITDADIVIIHDAVRPAAKPELFINLLDSFKDCDGVITGVPVIDTIKEVAKGFVVNTPDRSRLWLIQTPQAFKFKLLKDSYKKAIKEGLYFTDDSGLIEHYGGKVKVIMGSYQNLKITVPEDIRILEAILRSDENRYWI
jgi:2-C-methyl-D-erythritol 4-phosphate cytidylyltransferase